MSNFEIIKKALSKKVKNKEIKKESSFKELGLDSLDLIEIVLDVEKELDYHFNDEQLLGFKTIADVLDAIERKQYHAN